MKAPEPGDEQSIPRPGAHDLHPPQTAEDEADAGSVLARFMGAPKPAPPPLPDREDLMHKAVGAAILGQWHEAIAHLRELTGFFRYDVDGWAMLGLSHLARGEGEDARRCFTESLELEDTEEGYIGLGWAHVICGDHYWARHTFEGLLRFMPNSHKGLSGRGIVEVLLGNRLGAIAAAEHLEVLASEAEAAAVIRELLMKDEPRPMDHIAAKIAAELVRNY